jgi:IS605 OrfB family transposase
VNYDHVSANQIRHIRRIYAVRRKKLQAIGKHRAVKKLERRERRMIAYINHCLSKEVVALAQRCHAGIRLEDLSGIRQRSKQRKFIKRDAGQNRDYWPFFQLETFIIYKAHLAGVAVEKVPAAYTSKSCHCCGALGTRNDFALCVHGVPIMHMLTPTRRKISATGKGCAVPWFLRLQETGHMACP